MTVGVFLAPLPYFVRTLPPRSRQMMVFSQFSAPLSPWVTPSPVSPPRPCSTDFYPVPFRDVLFPSGTPFCQTLLNMFESAARSSSAKTQLLFPFKIPHFFFCFFFFYHFLFFYPSVSLSSTVSPIASRPSSLSEGNDEEIISPPDHRVSDFSLCAATCVYCGFPFRRCPQFSFLEPDLRWLPSHPCISVFSQSGFSFCLRRPRSLQIASSSVRTPQAREPLRQRSLMFLPGLLLGRPPFYGFPVSSLSAFPCTGSRTSSLLF